VLLTELSGIVSANQPKGVNRMSHFLFFIRAISTLELNYICQSCSRRLTASAEHAVSCSACELPPSSVAHI